MRQLRTLLAVILLFSTVLCLFSCGANGGEKDTTAPDTTEAVTTKADTTEAPEAVTLTVKVVDEEGNAVEGTMIQLCNEVNCFTKTSDADGNALFPESLISEITSVCYISVPLVSDGYEYNGEEKVYLEDGCSEYTVELTKVN